MVSAASSRIGSSIPRETDQATAHGEVEDRETVLRELLADPRRRCDVDAFVLQNEVAGPEDDAHPVHGTRDPVRDHVFDFRVVGFVVVRDPCSSAARTTARADRMGKVFFQARGQAEHFVFGEGFVERHDALQFGRTLRQRPVLSKTTVSTSDKASK